MACLLKVPIGNDRGVLSFTTPERDLFILKDVKLKGKIQKLKDRWLIGLHHNWHDYKFTYNPLFDFHMAGEEDLKEVQGRSIPLIPMDACNFVPACFRPTEGEKFWDVLYVARAVFFKGIQEFFDTVRSLFDQGHHYRILFICPMAPYKASDKKTVFYNIQEVYDRMFSDKEKDYFTLLTLNTRYPFPFDLETLAYFYRSSKLFVHFANEERRCRVAAYAWTSEIPVVGMSCVGSLLPSDLRKEPFYYEVTRYADFPAKIIAAVKAAAPSSADLERVRSCFADRFTTVDLAKQLETLLGAPGSLPDMSRYALAHLDIRLGRHHGISEGPNNIAMSLEQWVDLAQDNPDAMAEAARTSPDPEKAIEQKVQRLPITQRIKNHFRKTVITEKVDA